ncbi:MAG: putative toxin-antitoxin system toxin component, PIN family [Thermoplasmata archaeon]
MVPEAPEIYTTNYERIKEELFNKLPPEVFNLLNEWIRQNWHTIFLGGIDIKIVVDTNIVISEALALLKHGKSCLIKLSNFNILKLYAPEWLEEEVDKKIPQIAKKKKIDQSRLRDAVKRIMKVINLHHSSNIIPSVIVSKIRKRDPKDTPYLEIYLQHKAHAILTQDSDIYEIKEIKVLKRTGELKKILYIAESGMLAIFLSFEAIPTIATILCILLIEIIFLILEVLYSVGKSIYNALRNASEWFKSLPIEDKIFYTLFGFAVATVVLLFIYNNREKIFPFIKSFVKEIIKTLSEIKMFIEVLIQFVTKVYGLLLKDVEEVMTLYNEINRDLEKIMVDANV